MPRNLRPWALSRRATATPRITWMMTFVNAQNRLNVRIRTKSKFGMTMLLLRIRM
jgi:hypothetical protein